MSLLPALPVKTPSKTYIPLMILCLAFATGCAKHREIIVDHANPEIAYSGRIDKSEPDGVGLYWSGTSIRFNFEGSSIAVRLKDQSGDNYFNVIIDQGAPFLLRPDTTGQYQILADQLTQGQHSVEIFKRTEWDRGKTLFQDVKISGKNARILSKPAPKKRKLEFYGNSITAGYAVEDTSGKDRPDSTFTNNYVSYAAIAARHYHADYRCICKSGIGITISWFPLIMPEIYDRLIPEDPTSKWDFSLYTPDIVVVNLMQNDSWLINMPERAEFKANFGNKAPDDQYIISAYQEFITDIRNNYPDSRIICALGNMDATREGSKWTGYVERAVKSLNDTQIYTHFFPFKNTPGHPSIAEQEEMAKSLIKFIDDNITW